MHYSTGSSASTSNAANRSRIERAIWRLTVFAFTCGMLVLMLLPALMISPTKSLTRSSPLTKQPSQVLAPKVPLHAPLKKSIGTTDFATLLRLETSHRSNFASEVRTRAPFDFLESSTGSTSAPLSTIRASRSATFSNRNIWKRVRLFSDAGRRKSLMIFAKRPVENLTGSTTAPLTPSSSPVSSGSGTTRTSTRFVRRRSSWQRLSPRLTNARAKSVTTSTESLFASAWQPRQLIVSQLSHLVITRWSFTRASWAELSPAIRSTTLRIGSAMTG